MLFKPPLPRQRLYTSRTTYSSVLSDLAFGRLHRGSEVKLLERDISERLDVPYALAVNQCRVGIYLALKAVITDTKRDVIMSPFTIFDVVNMVICAGGRPVFADIERRSCTIDSSNIEQLINENTAAVLITHTHARCNDVDSIINICRSRNILLIEDAAVAFGTKHNGRAVGTLGDIGIYSFGLFKNVNAFYGGMVVTHNEELYNRIANEIENFSPISSMRLFKRVSFGMVIDAATSRIVFSAFTFWIFRFGFLHDIELINRFTRNDPNPFLRKDIPPSYSCRISSSQARLIRNQLDHVEKHMSERISIAEYYYNSLKDIPDVLLPAFSADGTHAFLVFPIQVKQRKALLKHLMTVGRDCASYYYRNCADLSCFSDFARDCPNARLATEQIVLLPTYPGYGMKEAEKNVIAVRDFYISRSSQVNFSP